MGTKHFCSFPPILASRPGKVPCSESQFHVCQQGSASQKWGEPKVKNIVCKIVPPKRAMWNGSYRGGSSKRVMCLCVVRVQLFPPLHSEMWEWLVPEFCFRVTARNHWRCRWKCKPHHHNWDAWHRHQETHRKCNLETLILEDRRQNIRKRIADCKMLKKLKTIALKKHKGKVHKKKTYKS